MIANVWTDFLDLVKSNPLVLEAIVVVILFVAALLVFRRIRRIADELERRKALKEYVRGLDEFLRRAYPEAIRILESVIERDPENVEARIALGDCYRETGDPAEAKKHHHHVHRVFGNELARNFLSLGLDELALNNYDQAVMAFQRARELEPHTTDALAGLAQAHAAAGNPAGAARYLRLVYPEGPQPDLPRKQRREAARLFTEAGAASLEEEDVEVAIRFFTEALAFQPESIRARTGILRAAQMLGDDARARDLVTEHLDVLRSLSEREDVLFEPAAPETARPMLIEAGSSSAPAPASGAAQPGRSLPALVSQVSSVAAAVERKTARYACAACGARFRDYADQCPTCDSVGTVEAVEGLRRLYTMPLRDFQEAVSEVEGSSAFLHKLARDAAMGDAAALDALARRGPEVLYEVFAVLPAIESPACLGARMAERLGPEAAREVARCRAARGMRPDNEFAAAYYLALGDADAEAFLPSIGAGRDSAVAVVLADPRVPDGARDRAELTLREWGPRVLAGVVDAVAATQDPGGIDRAAALVRQWGADAVDQLERNYLQPSLIGKLLRGKGARRRAVADILARSGLSQAKDALGRAAAQEKDETLRAHFTAAKRRAEEEPS